MKLDTYHHIKHGKVTWKGGKVVEMGGNVTVYFRPPFGWKCNRLLSATFLWKGNRLLSATFQKVTFEGWPKVNGYLLPFLPHPQYLSGPAILTLAFLAPSFFALNLWHIA